MSYKYKEINADGWIKIEHEFDTDSPEYFIDLVKCAQKLIGGKIIKVDNSNMIYKITGDPFNMQFQWDSLFGSIIIISDTKNINLIYSFLNECFKKLNNKI